MFASPVSRAAPAAIRTDLWVGAVLLLFTLVVRGAWFGDANADTDEQLYSLIGNAMLDGKIVFVDLWDRKPFGLFALYAIAHAIGGPGPEAYQGLAAAFTVAGAWLTFIMARDLTDRGTATTAGLLYVVLTAIYGAFSGNSEAFFIPMMLAMAVLVRDPAHPRAVSRMFLAMLIGGLALQVKYTVLPQCLFFGLWALWGQHRRGAGPGRLAPLAAVSGALGVLPTALVAVGYALAGHWDAFVFANFMSFFDRLPASAGRLHKDIILFLLPLGGLALFGLNAARRAAPLPQTYVFVLLWLGTALATVFLPSTVYRYYLGALVPACILLSLPLFPLKPGTRLNLPVLIPAALYLVLVPFQYGLTHDNRTATERLASTIAPQIDAAVGRCLFVFDGPTALYRMTGSCLPTRFIYPDHLNNALEQDALGTSQVGEVARILAARPPVIVTADHPVTPQNREAKRLVAAAIKRGYRQIAHERLATRDIRAFALRE